MTTTRRLRSGLLLGLLVVAACRVGGWNDDQVAAARGGTVDLELAGDDVRGELLVVDEEGVLVLAASEILGARWTSMERLKVRDRPVQDVRDGEIPSADRLRQLQLASRYPFGLPDDQLAALLASLDQDDVREIR